MRIALNARCLRVLLLALCLVDVGAVPCEERESETGRGRSASEGRHGDVLGKIQRRRQVLLYAGMTR